MESDIKLACLAAAFTLQREDLALKMIEEMKESEFKREFVREAIIQTYLFDGYPTALEGLIFLYQNWKGDAEPVESGDFNHWKDWLERGQILYDQIYGEVAEELQLRAKRLSPELANWMLVEGYGKVLSRSTLDIKTREIITIAILTVKDRPRQLHSHIRGALRVGADKEKLFELFETMKNEFHFPSVEKAEALLQKILKD